MYRRHSENNTPGQGIYARIPGHDDDEGRTIPRRAHSCSLPNQVRDTYDYLSFHSLDDSLEREVFTSQNGAAAVSPKSNTNADVLIPDVTFSDEHKKSEVPPALDGGWGWMCVFGCWLMHFLIGGFGRSFGVVYVEMMDKFECSATIGSTIGGLFTAVRMGLGPLVGVFMKKFSVRTVAIFGAIVFASGSIMCAFAKSSTYMFISYGVICGLGGALVYFPSVIIVGQYFDRRRGVAMGFSTAGSGIGCIAMPPLYRIMFNDYGWQGTFIIVGGVLLNLVVCAALYRPLEHTLRGKKSTKNSSATIENQIVPETSTRIDEDNIAEGLDETKVIQNQNQSPDGEFVLNQNIDIGVDEATSLIRHHNSDEIHDSTTRHSNSEAVTTSVEKSTVHQKIHDGETVTENVSLISSKPTGNCCAKVSGWFDLSLLLQPVFLCYLIALTLATMAYISAQNLIMAHAIDIGVEAYLSVLVLSIVGISDTVGRVLSGITYDIPFVRRRRSYWYAFVLICSGLSMLGWALCRNFIELAVLSVANGVFNGAIVAGRPIIVADLVGMGKMTSAFGLTVFCQGVGIMIGPFFAGYLKDLTGTYFMSYIFASACSCFGGLVFFLGYCGNSLYRGRQHISNEALPNA